MRISRAGLGVVPKQSQHSIAAQQAECALRVSLKCSTTGDVKEDSQ